MKRTGPTNPLLKKQIEELKAQKAGIWKRLAYELERATRKKREINLSSLQRNTKDGETVLALGKVLGAGSLNKKLTVAAWNFSAKAAAEIEKVGGSTITISDLIKKNPKGTGIKIIG